MKQAINQVLPVEFGDTLSLDDVKRIEFLFKQRTVTRSVLYPSSECERSENVIRIGWTPEQAAAFAPDYDVELDTRITLTGTDIQPETPIVRFKINRSLFKAGDDA